MSVEIGTGYRPGVLGWCVMAHARYYAREWGFGRFFEAKLGAEMAEFLGRLDAPGNHLFWAAEDEALMATLALDGGTSEDGLAHLRWFIVQGPARGRGHGQRLIASALETAREEGAGGLYLWTFSGLDAARRVYEKAGFAMVLEREDRTWGKPVREQRFELRF